MENIIKKKNKIVYEGSSKNNKSKSEYLSWVYTLLNNISNINETADMIDILEEIMEEVECREEFEKNKFNHIPEQFQNGEVGCMLQDRIENLDDAYARLNILDNKAVEEINEEFMMEEIKNIIMTLG